MFALQHDFFVALNQARKASRRGDIATAECWLKCAEKHVRISERMKKLTEPPRQDLRFANPRKPYACP